MQILQDTRLQRVQPCAALSRLFHFSLLFILTVNTKYMALHDDHRDRSDPPFLVIDGTKENNH